MSRSSCTFSPRRAKATHPPSSSRTSSTASANYKLETGETAPASLPTYSELLGKTLAKFADTNNKIVAITAAMPTGTGLVHFQKKHPERYYDVGIAEEHAALFACGMAVQGSSRSSRFTPPSCSARMT
ncbi:MAG: hypothetical protein QM796_03555 [Chthoniobacteraceae bacterium]